MNVLLTAIDRLGSCDILHVPRDELQLPGRLRECLAELRVLARALDEDEDTPAFNRGYDEGYDHGIYDTDEQNARRLNRLRDHLTEAAGLPSWQWRKLDPALAELLE
jgi:hypothetical protein